MRHLVSQILYYGLEEWFAGFWVYVMVSGSIVVMSVHCTMSYVRWFEQLLALRMVKVVAEKENDTREKGYRGCGLASRKDLDK